ncbi:MAG TPA: sulfotransferase [Rhizomicrobium sp.]|nr:sulfotransferase [Rhizomicrobium sp.]
MTDQSAITPAPNRRTIEGPDFICIGMPKAGTRWLFDQLSHHPEFWMPASKGVHYFRAKGSPKMSAVARHLERVEKGKRRARGHELDERNQLFLRDAVALGSKPRDLRAYASLFRHKGAQLSGDITAAYADLKEQTIEEIAASLPNVKIVLLVREPVSRAWSRASMAWRKNEFDETILHDIDRLREYIGETSWLSMENSSPTRIIARWRAHAPNLEFRYFLFDDLVADADELRKRILTFLGADPDLQGKLPPSHNQKSEHEKLKVPEQAMAAMAEHYKDELRACAELLGGAARNWPARYGF